MPHPDEAAGEVEVREVQKERKKVDEAPLPARTPVEHAINCTFRLANKRGGGSGFFISQDGLAVTAKHVVKGVTYSMKAELRGDDRTYNVRILKKSTKHDLALLRVSVDRDVPFLVMRDPSSLIGGEEVFAIGNPLLAFKGTVTRGIFSRIFMEEDFKKELKVKPPFKGDWIQFSASTIGGNSGGPVVDRNGKLVGVVSLGLREYSAVNFAVPSSYIHSEFASHLP